jgi:ABC-type multidrug transport system fused ATPase/permease subunit
LKSTLQHSCGAIAIFLSWLNLVMFMSPFPKFGLYIMMFQHVLSTFFEFFTVLFIFILGFAFTFRMILSHKMPFQDTVTSVISILVMMIGEMEFQDTFIYDNEKNRNEMNKMKQEMENKGSYTFNDKFNERSFWNPEQWSTNSLNSDFSTEDKKLQQHQLHTTSVNILTYATFCLFVIFMSIVTMNLMMGLAVDDIDKIMENSESKKIKLRIHDCLQKEFEPLMAKPITYFISKKMRVEGNRFFLKLDYKTEKYRYLSRSFFSEFYLNEVLNPDDFIKCSKDWMIMVDGRNLDEQDETQSKEEIHMNKLNELQNNLDDKFERLQEYLEKSKKDAKKQRREDRSQSRERTYDRDDRQQPRARHYD